jgi:transcriptional regulator with XRE-family HTH domain
MGDTLGQRLREAMDRQDMTPASLARAADTTEATVSGWLRDMVKPDHVKAVQLFKIADAAKTSPRGLLFGGQAAERVSEDHAEYWSQPERRDVLKLAFQLVAEVLESGNLELPPHKQAEAALLAFELLEEGLPQAKVLRFVRAAVA